MLPNFLVPETDQSANGESEAIALGESKGKLISLTLGITRIIEQESLDVSILGSSDGEEWGAKPIASFPQKFYCGEYTILVDLAAHPDIAHLKVSWKMGRWGRGAAKPLFAFYVFAEESAAVTTASASGATGD
jgi:hypothetical protein